MEDIGQSDDSEGMEDSGGSTDPGDAGGAESDVVECEYCDTTVQDEPAIRKHLSEDHRRTELSRIDRKRVELYDGG
jgi:hypothetical protein